LVRPAGLDQGRRDPGVPAAGNVPGGAGGPPVVALVDGAAAYSHQDAIELIDNRISALSNSPTTDPVPFNGVGECKICFLDKYINNTMVPCGHNGYCMDCLTDIKNSNHPFCPLCRTKINEVVKVFDQLKSDDVHMA